ncbi:sulfite exporter TauE/SafE family protein [Streptomyces piniterrae]|uniref:Probable membrane transporter protein n=1 Tax=Streptomyces piniterrae TaxID=2571125 RepID=A0A4U0NQV0_9ACTN|nr:sulfite exporter TauE/SafE family protein [Streptomyces piniterrae]TJZ56949.1 sulfite exporter TauE/SafE family protein [Streptomyces piniterrae]
MTGAWAAELLLGGIVLAASSVQRLAGIGFALVAVPALVLLLGPSEGVALANCGAGLVSAVGLADGWRDVRLRAMLPLVLAAGCCVPVGTWVARRLPEPQLLAGMGALMTTAVLVVMRGVRVASLRGTKGALAAGAASGFMNSAAGVGGPAISLYAVNAGWTVREFIPNAQFYGLLVNALSLAANGAPRLSTAAWLLVAVAVAAGSVTGKALAARIPEGPARRLVLLLALAGALVTLGKGLWGW